MPVSMMAACKCLSMMGNVSLILGEAFGPMAAMTDWVYEAKSIPDMVQLRVVMVRKEGEREEERRGGGELEARPRE